MSKFEEETKMDGFLKFVIAILIIIVTGIAALVGFGFHLAAEEERYIESLSPDELKKYQEEKGEIDYVFNLYLAFIHHK